MGRKSKTQLEIEQRQKIQKNMQVMNEFHNQTYDYMRDQLEFASGDQWQDVVKSQREKTGRPTVVLNLTKSYVNRIVNPVRMNPVGVRIGTDNKELTDLVSGIVRQVEVESRAKEAYETAYENAVTCGLGWIKLGTDYVDDESLEQKVTVDIVRNPMSVWMDPYAKRIDGSDAKFAVHMEFIPADEAEREYGEEATGSGIGGIDIYEYWQVPENSVPDFTYYEIECEKLQRYWYEDGSSSDNDANPDKVVVQQRLIENKQVRAIRYVGNKKIQETLIPIPYIPLVPVFGDYLYLERESKVHHSGIVHWLMDSQRMVNFYGSNELELASLAPKAPWIVAEGQIEGYEDIWASANTEAVSALPYKPDTIGGQAVPPPTRVDNQAQTGALIQSRQKSQEDMGREIGIFDNMLGQVQAANETGKAALLRANQGELPTAHYLQNYEQSIAQVGRVILYLLAWVGDTPRMVGVRDERGQKVMVETTLSEILTPKFLKHAEVETTAGPAYESRRRESINAILQLGQVMPEKMGMMADLLVENMDAPGAAEIAERLRKSPDIAALLEEGGGPTKEELEMQLQQAQAQIAQQTDTAEKLEGIIRQLQAQIISKDKDRQADIAKTLIKEEGSMAREKLKQHGEDERTALKIEADAEADMRSFAGEVFKQENDRVNEAALGNFESTDYVPPVRGPLSVPESEANQAQSDIENTLSE